MSVAVEQHLAGQLRRSGTSSCIRLRIRRNVDLPQPDGPISAVTCAGRHGQRDPVEHLVVAEPALTSRASSVASVFAGCAFVGAWDPTAGISCVGSMVLMVMSPSQLC